MGKISQYFKPKQQKKDVKVVSTSFWYKLFVAVLVIATLGVALLWPEQISALWFEFWLLVLQFLHTPVIFQMWWFIPFVFVVAWLGKYFFPAVDIPTSDASFIYYKSHDEGQLRFFNLVNGHILVVAKKYVKKKWIRWQTLVPLNLSYRGRYIVAETAKLEVTETIHLQNLLKAEIEHNKKLESELARKETRLSKDEWIELEKARHGGERE